MRNARTDMASEAVYKNKPSGAFSFEKEEKDGIEITRVEIKTEEEAEKIGKVKGKYISVDFPGAFNDESLFRSAENAITEEIKGFVGDGSVLIAGLGNPGLTSDSIGPKTKDGIVVTRHIKDNLPELYASLRLRDIAAIVPGVLGQTGIESGNIIKAVTEKIKPSTVLIIDSLCTKEPKRICSVVQISDAGISPGSGVGNDRGELSKKTLGVPVVAIGIPTVTDASCLYEDGENGNLFVTPRDIDVLVSRSSKLLSSAINRALHPGLSAEEISALIT